MMDAIQRYFICKRCGYHAKTKQLLQKHLMRKTVCKASSSENEYLPEDLLDELNTRNISEDATCCQWCSRAFNNRTNMYRHQKMCKMNQSLVCTNELVNKVHFLENQVKTLTEQLQNGSNMRNCGGSVSQHIENQQNIQTQNNYQNQTNIASQNIQVIQFQNFGNERLEHLSDDYLTNCVKNLGKGMANLFQEIHFNDKVPENKNIRNRSITNNLLEKYVDGRWVPCDKNNTLDQVIEEKSKMMYLHYNQVKDHDQDLKNCEDIILRWFMEMQSKTGAQFYRVRRDIYAIILADAEQNNKEPIYLQVV